MQKAQDTLNSQRSAMQGLQSAFSSLQSTMTSVGNATHGSLTATPSDSTVISAHASAGALDGTYTIEVTGVGSSTTTLSKAGLTTVTDASSQNISGSSSFTLTINNVGHTITPTGNSLQSLAVAINDASLGVHATIVNIGSTSSPDYRLSLSSNHYAADTIQLNDGSNDLLDTLSTGSNVTYKVNGISTDLQSDSRTVTLAPGLTVDILKAAPGQPVTVNVAHDYSQLENSFTNLAAAYNAASAALGQQRGKGAGPLAGQSVVFSLEQTLRDITQYSATSGAVTSLADLGFTLGQDGTLSFDRTAFEAAATSDIQTFLGSSDAPGFLKEAGDALSSVADSVSGSLENSIESLNGQIQRSNDQMSAEQDRIDSMTANLQTQLSNADAAIAVLEGQVTYMTNLFATLFLHNSSGKTNE
jgi:flagellar hook-associated protein 2